MEPNVLTWTTLALDATTVKAQAAGLLHDVYLSEQSGDVTPDLDRLDIFAAGVKAWLADQLLTGLTHLEDDYPDEGVLDKLLETPLLVRLVQRTWVCETLSRYCYNAQDEVDDLFEGKAERFHLCATEPLMHLLEQTSQRLTPAGEDTSPKTRRAAIVKHQVYF